MSCVYLIPSLLNEEGLKALPSYLVDAIKSCQVFFVENERTTRRYFKKILPAIVIDDHEWVVMDENAGKKLREKIKAGKTIGIVSEAGCPGVADPGQAMVAIAQEMEIDVKPLVGPNSILLALMASGMNGQQFRFNGYLPIDRQERMKMLKELEADSLKNNCTEIFIETPYRNNQLVEAILEVCRSSTKLCLAVDLTGETEWIKTKPTSNWKKNKPDIHKRPAIFLLYAEV